MVYVRGILSAVTAVVLSLCVPGLVSAFRGISREKATGVAVLAAGLQEALLSPGFWIVAIALFALFFAASRMNNKALSILLFWVPTLFVTTLTGAIAALITYAILRYPGHQ